MAVGCHSGRVEPGQYATSADVCHPAVGERLHAVDKDVSHAGRKLVRIFIRGAVGQGRQVKEHEIRLGARADDTAVLHAHHRGRQTGHGVNSPFHGQEWRIHRIAS